MALQNRKKRENMTGGNHATGNEDLGKGWGIAMVGVLILGLFQSVSYIYTYVCAICTLVIASIVTCDCANVYVLKPSSKRFASLTIVSLCFFIIIHIVEDICWKSGHGHLQFVCDLLSLVSYSIAITFSARFAWSTRSADPTPVKKRNGRGRSKLFLVGATFFGLKLCASVARMLIFEYQVESAKFSLKDNFRRSVQLKWTIQTKKTNGFFYRYIEDHVLYCHPYDAFSNPTWNVSWVYDLTEDEVDFANSIMRKLADHHYDSSNPKLGLTSFISSRHAEAPWITWAEASRYISLNAVIRNPSSDDSVKLQECIIDFMEVASAVDPPLKEVLCSGVFSSFAQMLTFADKPAVQLEAALAMTSLPTYLPGYPSNGEVNAVIESGYIPIYQLPTLPYNFA